MGQVRRYGLIGFPLSHSFSGSYFHTKFEKEKRTDCRYDLFPIENISHLPSLLQEYPELCGLNVTIPYKEQVLPYLNELSDAVREIGACNCIRISNGKLEGHNTDVVGFENTLIPLLKSHHHSALILGTGGAAKAVAWVLKKRGISYWYVSRKSSPETMTYLDCSKDFLASTFLVINTTPLGMYPQIDIAPELNYHAIGNQHVLIDLIYNPSRTLFMKKGEERGAVVENGLKMLEIQADESWKIWQQNQ